MTIDTNEVQAKIDEYLSTVHGTAEAKATLQVEFNEFVDWLKTTERIRNERYALFLELKNEFEPEAHPCGVISWMLREDGAHIAVLNESQVVVGRVQTSPAVEGVVADVLGRGAKILATQSFQTVEGGKAYVERQLGAQPTRRVIEWRRTPGGAYVASIDGRDVANAWPNGEGWVGQRWATGSCEAQTKGFDSREDAKAWAVEHLKG